uniref:Uncharacterized protein n=1 Tax=Rhizophora mucronata TaxID=61149 RepID=A0A2P2QDI7_RHIMU
MDNWSRLCFMLFASCLVCCGHTYIKLWCKEFFFPQCWPLVVQLFPEKARYQVMDTVGSAAA